MKLLIITAAILTLFSTTTNADYFWRDYYGEIPQDAIEGGRNVDGTITYIGQAIDRKLHVLMPGTIYKNDKYVYHGKLPEGKSDSFNKILCSHDTSDLMWVKTNMTNLHLLTECNQIIGGYYNQAILLIGRANHQGITYIGRIYDYAPNKWEYFSTFDMANNLVHLQEFEVLTHGCKKIPNELTVRTF